MERRYRHLLFDVDNTLLDFDRSEMEAMLETLAGMGLPATPENVTVYSRINNDHWKQLERGEIDRETLYWHRFTVLSEVLGREIDAHRMAALYFERLATKSFLCEDAAEVCRVLFPHYTLVAVTNGNSAIQHSRFDTSPLRPYFTAAFISEEIGYDKPSAGFFAAVRRALPALTPDAALVIGDSLTSDVAGGQVLGSDTCWLCRAGARNPEKKQPVRPTYTVHRLRELLPLLLPEEYHDE